MSSRERLLTPAFALLWAMTFLTFFAAFQLFPTVPLRLIALGASTAESGRFMSLFTAGSAVGALFTGPLGDRVGQRRMMRVCAAGFAGFLLSYGFIGSRLGFYALAIPHGLGWNGLLTAPMATVGPVAPGGRPVGRHCHLVPMFAVGRDHQVRVRRNLIEHKPARPAHTHRGRFPVVSRRTRL